MTQPTLPPSAGTTTSTDGQPPIDPFSESISVAAPSLRWRLWFRWVEFKHLFGIHHSIEMEEWDLVVGSVRFLGTRCLICDTEC